MPSFGEHRETLATWTRFPALERAPVGRSLVALTFDDGPDPDRTPAILDALDDAGASATFFCVGEQLMGRAELGRELVTRGHEVALHGFAHPRLDQVSDREARDDLARGAGAVEAATGTRPRWFRPPYGRFSEAAYEACRALSLEPVTWSAWGLDWEPLPAERIADLAARDLEDGAILVLHDSARYAPHPDACRETAAATPLIAAEAAARGLSLTTLGDAAG